MNGLISLISLLALLLAVSGQLSTLSPSFSYQGIIAATVNGQVSYTGTISQSVDMNRGLSIGDTTIGLAFINKITLYSVADNTVYESISEVCVERALTANDIPYDMNIWDLYAAGIEFPTGIFTFTRGLIIYQVTIVNGEPALFTTTTGNVIEVTTVTSFDNTTPAFSTFSLPSGCSQFTCTACYHTPPFPVLSPSYSLQGSLVRTENGVHTLTDTYSVFVDISQRLQFVNETVTTTTGDVSNNLRLSSGTDSATYLSVNGVCDVIALNPNIIFPLNTNVWDLYAAGIESPTGTYTYTQGLIVYQVTIVNGKPATFTSTTSTTVSVITVSNFYNTTPAFSTFSLPSGCSQFTCTACYQTPPFPNLSPSYSLQGALVRTVNGVQALTDTYSVSVDVNRQLQFVDETVTTKRVVSNNLRLSSGTDRATYLSVNGVCSVTAFNPNIISPIDINVWDLYAAGTESTTGTFTYTQNGTVNQVTIRNGEPLFISSTTGTSKIDIIVTHFDNTTPAFSTFSLPSECSQFNCTACYNSAVNISISVLLLLTTLLLYLFSIN